MGVYDFDLESYIGLARRLGTDTERVEVKAASQGLPKSMAETLSAFSNTSGGVVILGLAERAGFQGVPGFMARDVRREDGAARAGVSRDCRVRRIACGGGHGARTAARA